MSLKLAEITELLQRRGEAQYGREAINQLQHALQCASLAEQAGETPESVVAAERESQSGHDSSEDDLHQYMALPFLRGTLPEAVLEPIRLHVDAKRYLCLIEPSYRDLLSSASRHSLAQQGGVFSEAEAEAFLAQPYAEEAVRLRRYDDLAKVVDKAVPGLEHYQAYLRQVAF